MYRLVSFVLLSCIAALALVSCRASFPSELPPMEVLQRTVFAHAVLHNVSWDGTVTFRAPGVFSGSFLGSGTMYEGGSSWSASGFLRSSAVIPSMGVVRLSGTVQLLSTAPGTVLLRPIGALSGVLGEMLQESSHADDAPWILLMGDLDAVSQSVIPPSLAQLQALASSFEIVASEGLRAKTGSSPQYHLSLKLATAENNQQPLPLAEGEVWIDARRFLLQRVLWKVVSRSDDHVLASIDVRFSDYNHSSALPSIGRIVSAPPELATFFSRLHQ